MNKTKCYAVVLFAMAISLGYFSSTATAQQFSDDGYGHSGSCAGGCSHAGGNDSLELVPYGQSGQAAFRQSYQPQERMPPHGRGGMMDSRSGYAQPFQNRDPYQSAQRSPYRDNLNSQSGRGGSPGYEKWQESLTYADNPASGPSSYGHYGPVSCRRGCPRGPHEEFDLRGYDGIWKPDFESGRAIGIEADQTPQLDRYRPSRSDPSAANGRSSQMRQGLVAPPMPAGVGTNRVEPFAPTGPPPTSFGIPRASGSAGDAHAGCNHDH